MITILMVTVGNNWYDLGHNIECHLEWWLVFNLLGDLNKTEGCLGPVSDTIFNDSAKPIIDNNIIIQYTKNDSYFSVLYLKYK